MAAMLLSPLPEVGGERGLLLFRELENAGHPVLFAGVAWVILRFLMGKRGAYGLTLIACAVLGAATELAQLTVARDASFIDFFNDLLGAGAFLLLHARYSAPASPSVRRRWQLGLAIAFVAGAFAPLTWTCAAYVHRSQQLPVLWQADSAMDRLFATRFRLEYQGISIDEPWPDWRGFRTLVVELQNPNAADLEINLRVHDRSHSNDYRDRFNESVTLARSSRQTLRIPLARIEAAPAARRMRLDAIAGLIVFTSRNPQRIDFLRSARLER